jgi:hypothetical protein
MADIEIQEAILHAELIQRINAPLTSYERRKLPGWLETDLTDALAAARTQWSAFLFAGGDVAGARLKVKEARPKIAGLIRNTQSHIESLPDDVVSAADKLDALVSLGFEQGELGPLEDPTHLASLADQIVRENNTLPVAVRVPTTITSRLGNWLAILNVNEDIAGGGAREVITERKDTARDGLFRKIARVRLYIASTTDEGEGDPALAIYGFQPKRDPGDAQPQPLPEMPGTATFDSVTRLLTIPALPAHATSIVAWRQAAGGDAEPVGISITTSVSVSETSPLVPGVTYQLWVTGRNSRGDGLPSNKITYLAT